MIDQQLILDVHDELVIDNFAGGGGASTGIELALGRHVDVAINHDPQAVAMHRANHPQTEHHCESVWDVDPRAVHPGRPIGLLWLSPDCKHFSKAKGGKPVEKRIRALAWVALRWVAIRRPRVLMLENVEEFTTWGPVVCGEDGTCRPCPKRKGREFRAFVNALRRHGYAVEWRELRACDYGAPTIRKRLFLVARCDGQPIRWPEPTHGDPASDAVKRRQLKPWRTAAECIDWSLPCPSIFERARPLADATLRRVAKGIMRYVVNAAEPFIVNTRNGERAAQQPRTRGVHEPLWTVTAQGSQGALVSAFLAKHYGGVVGSDLRAPAPTVTSVDHNSLVTAQLEKVYASDRSGQTAHKRQSDRGQERRHDLETQKPEQDAACRPETPGDQDQERLPGSSNQSPRERLFATCSSTGVGGFARPYTGRHDGQPSGWMQDEQPPREPGGCDAERQQQACLPHAGAHRTASDSVPRFGLGPGSSHSVTPPGPSVRRDRGEVGDFADDGVSSRAREVMAFLHAYYGTDQDPDLRDPMHTVTTRDRYALVTVAGQQYAIADIGLRMLAPRELFAAQGFPASYIIEHGIDERGQRLELTKTAQVRMCGNSVCPPLAAALVRVNLGELAIRRAA